MQIGDRAPEFELQDQEGQWRSLAQFVEAGPLVLYFYPIDFSPVCTAQACAMRDRYDSAAVKGIQIVGVSAQSVASHARFAAMHELPFPLLADPDKRVIKAYDADGFMGFGTRRVTYLIDAQAVIRNRVVADLTIGAHKALLEKVVAEWPPIRGDDAAP